MAVERAGEAHEASEEQRPLPGLRQRQKSDRSERILASAERLFDARGFERTTMAAIAADAGVSTPTVFNYFGSKDLLLLALVLKVHHATQASVSNFEADPSSALAEVVCDFLALYTETSLAFVSRRTWRHVESTRIRMPDSEFVREYDTLAEQMLDDFHAFLLRTFEQRKLTVLAQLRDVAAILFNHWSALFIELIRDEELSLDAHVGRLRTEVAALMAWKAGAVAN